MIGGVVVVIVDIVDKKLGAVQLLVTIGVLRLQSFKVIMEDEDQYEISFTRTCDLFLKGKYALLNIDRSDEFRTGDFVKQNLTSHVGPATLAIDVSQFTLFRRRPSAKIPKLRVVEKGSEINLDVLVYELPRDSPTLWEIGIEKHMVKTRIYRFRQYGLLERKKLETGGYEGTTWKIIFKLEKMNKKGTYKLRVSHAFAALVELQIRVNDAKTNPPHFTTGLMGRDNSIA
ncbi:hypothetical protein GIB67_031833 [Kingdonia uniflora]|uniref:Rhamnogalacturonan lyase domain-containing protein n=1 Tax=Kingdonia uniflora TaxID=39325 RepID=A0A7J7L4S0_9MAGN|nr:hypothetical protein GIB67_031833 [Kingdonia uniflora]